MPSFGEHLLAWRRSRGLTQTQVAQAAAIPQPNVCALEADRLEPKLSTIRRLAVALNLSPGNLIEKMPPPPRWDRRRIDEMVRQAFSDKTPQRGPQGARIRALRNVLHGRLAAAGRKTRRAVGGGQRSLRQLQADLGPALWNALVRRLDKYR